MANPSQSPCISSHIARSLADAARSPARPVDVITGSRLAMLVSFIASADGDRPIASENLMISGFLWCSLPNGSRQYSAKATNNSCLVHLVLVDILTLLFEQVKIRCTLGKSNKGLPGPNSARFPSSRYGNHPTRSKIRPPANGLAAPNPLHWCK